MTPIILRFAAQEDCLDIFTWRNDPVTIAVSPSGAVRWEEHIVWFEEKMNSPQTQLFIATNEKAEKLGIIRFDRQKETKREKREEEKEDAAEVSININPFFRSQGYGAMVLQQALDIYFANFPVQTIFAQIMPENIVSLKLFRKMGFVEESVRESNMVKMMKERNLERI